MDAENKLLWNEVCQEIRNINFFCQNDHVSHSPSGLEYVQMHTPLICERNMQPCSVGGVKSYYNECDFYGCDNKCDCGGPCLLLWDQFICKRVTIIHHNGKVENIK